MKPLAEQMRPRHLHELVGQQHLLAPGKALHKVLSEGPIHSMVFWGPPGTGKTTLANVIANTVDYQFITLSAVLSGVKDIREAVKQAQEYQQAFGKGTVVFVDEVHRFNKSQQDAFLPHIENGTFIFIGATTENPSFELNNALLSRVRVYVLKSLQQDDLRSLLDRVLALQQEQRQVEIVLDEAAGEALLLQADGDARRLLNFVEILLDYVDVNEKSCLHINEDAVNTLAMQSMRRFDKGGEAFYDQISALHKSVRGSAPDAALYWFCRMIDGGCDPHYLARRILRMASEDVGNADPRAIAICLDAWSSFDRLGSPEGELALAQAVLYLASVPKSNAVYMAYNQAMDLVKKQNSVEVPLHLRNAPTRLMKELDYGSRYRYAHDEPHGYAAGEHYFPDSMLRSQPQFYQPVDRGMETKIRARLEWLRSLDRAYQQQEEPV